jgi:hypothetical protein
MKLVKTANDWSMLDWGIRPKMEEISWDGVAEGKVG